MVGGGGPLSVSLNVTPAHPTAGAAVTLRTNVSGGSGPYTFSYVFGDGTDLLQSNQSTLTHAYGYPGGFCAVVVVSDAQQPPDGGESSAVAVPVGATSTARCVTSPGLSANLTVPIDALDLPGDFVFDPVATGGVAPYSVTYTSNDPYSSVCRCPVFSTVGNHTVNATISDSLDAVATASANVTLYPALTGHFTASRSRRPAPLSINFTATLSGGHLPDANATRWEFGDGSNSTGAFASHTYPNPGFYVATALASDGFGGHASAAFLVDAYASGSAPSTVLTAEVAPALDVPVGVPVNYTAEVSGTSAPYLIRLEPGDNDTAFGPSVSETYPYDGCGSPSKCPLSVGIGAEDASGAWTNLTIPLTPVEEGNSTALALSVAGVGPKGVTPYSVHAEAQSRGMPMTTFSWSFGDGGSLTGPYGNHTYLTPGNYTVSVRASDPYGDHLVETRSVTVSGIQRYPPSVIGNSNVSAGIGPLSVQFTAAASGGSGGPYTYAWSFGDGTSGPGPSIDHLYRSPGSFEANVTAYDRLGESATHQIQIRVYATTPLLLVISGLPSTLDAGKGVPVSLRERPSCGPDSRTDVPHGERPDPGPRARRLGASPGQLHLPRIHPGPGRLGVLESHARRPVDRGTLRALCVGERKRLLREHELGIHRARPDAHPAFPPGPRGRGARGALVVLAAVVVVISALVLHRRRHPPPRKGRKDRSTTP